MSQESQQAAVSSNSRLNQLFIKLHNFQIALIQNPCKTTALEYRSRIVETIDNDNEVFKLSNESRQIFEFVILPVVSACKRVNSSTTNRLVSEWSDLNECLLGCALALVDKYPHPIELTQFVDILNVCSIVLSRYGDEKCQQKMSDELLTVCVSLISRIFERSNDSIDAHFLSVSSLTTIGLLVAKLLDIVAESGSIQVRLDSLRAFKSILTRPGRESGLQARVGVLFSSFLPGISIRIIQKFLLHENLKILNHKLICSALDVLGLVLACVFDDSLLDNSNFQLVYRSCFTKDTTATTSRKSEIEALLVNRIDRPEWLSESSQKVFYLLEHLMNALVLHESRYVKLALVRMCARVAQSCYFGLNSHLEKLLQVLVTCAVDPTGDDDNMGDENNRVVIEAIDTIEHLENKEINMNYKFVQPNRFSLVSSSINELLLKLPRLMTETDSNGPLSADSRAGYLRTVLGYLKLIGGHHRRRQQQQQQQQQPQQPSLVEFFLNNEQNLNHLMDALVNCVKFDYASLNNFYEIQVASSSGRGDNGGVHDDDQIHLSHYKGLETYLVDRGGVFQHLRSICIYLGMSDAARLVVDLLLNSDLTFIENRKYKLEALFLIDLILLGLEKRTDQNPQEKLAIINMILSNHLNDLKQSPSCDLMETLKTSDNNNNDYNNSSTWNRNRRILQICLILEVISTTSRFFALSDDFSVLFLIDNLYFTLENYLSPNLLIKCVAYRCLHELARNLKHASPQELLSANYDLLMNDLVLKSNNLNRRLYRHLGQQQQHNDHSSHVLVLCALIRVANADLCPHLERLIDDYLFAAQINSTNQPLIEGICKIVAFMAESMRRWYPMKFELLSSPINDHDASESDNYDLSRLDLKRFTEAKRREDEKKSFVEGLREVDEQFGKTQKEKAMWEENDTSEYDQHSSNDKSKSEMDYLKQEEEEDAKLEAALGGGKKKDRPLHVTLQVRCLELCTHLISHPSREVRLQCIGLVRELSKNLAEHQDDFLPLVHKLWSPICQRFSLDDHIVKARILFALFDLCVLSGDFLASRFVKELLPRVCQFMREQCKQSLVSSSSAATTYVYSQAFKLQCAVLANIDKICVVVEIKQMELEWVLDSIVVPCLDKRQPKRLQALAVDAMRTCAYVDADTVWLVLLCLLPFRTAQMRDVYVSECERGEQMYKLAGMSMFTSKMANLQLTDEVLASLVSLFNDI